jgi:hypothetical protein
MDAAEEAWCDGRIVHELAAGSQFWRVLRAEPPANPLGYARICHPSDVRNRFTPIELDGRVVPSAYAGSTREIALWESVLRSIRHKGIKRVPQHETSNRFLVQTRTIRPLKLLDLRRPKDANLVAGRKRPPKLTAAPESAYAVTREWAQRLYTRIPKADGFIYESYQLPGDCIVLLQSRDPVAFRTVDSARPVSKEPVRTILRNEARQAGAVVDFGDFIDVP